MNKLRNLTYITYQTFPANTANSLQTISNIAEIVKQGVKVKLIFPDRDNLSSDSLVKIQNFYGIEQDFEIVKLNFAINVISTKQMFSRKSLIGINPYLYKLDENEGFDINSEFEFSFAEFLFNKINS